MPIFLREKFNGATKKEVNSAIKGKVEVASTRMRKGSVEGKF